MADLTSKKAVIITMPVDGVTFDPDNNAIMIVDGSKLDELHTTNVPLIAMIENVEVVEIRASNSQTHISIQSNNNNIHLGGEGNVITLAPGFKSATAPNLKPENIKKGVTILGVTGTLE